MPVSPPITVPVPPVGEPGIGVWAGPGRVSVGEAEIGIGVNESDHWPVPESKT